MVFKSPFSFTEGGFHLGLTMSLFEKEKLLCFEKQLLSGKSKWPSMNLIWERWRPAGVSDSQEHQLCRRDAGARALGSKRAPEGESPSLAVLPARQLKVTASRQRDVESNL